jgi:hypothetical protein
VDDEPDVPEVRPPTLEDVRTICRALQEAGARLGDLQKYRVVRVADEVMVDLLAAAGAVTWAEASETALRIDLDGTPVIVADADTLIRTKRTIRPSDAADRAFLEALRDENH